MIVRVKPFATNIEEESGELTAFGLCYFCRLDGDWTECLNFLDVDRRLLCDPQSNKSSRWGLLSASDVLQS